MSEKMSKKNFLLDLLEEIIKKPQVWWLTKKKLHFAYRKGQLWLIQEDFEESIKRKRRWWDSNPRGSF